MTRRRIALEKLFAHLTGQAIVAAGRVLVALLIVGRSVNGLPGDEISVQMAAGYALWLFLLGHRRRRPSRSRSRRSSAAGRRPASPGAVMFGGFILNGYQAAIPTLAPLANLTWFGWTSNHVPLAGQFDWVSLLPVAVVAVVLFVVGVEAFARRDIGATSPIPTPSLPRALVGLRGPDRPGDAARTCRRRSPGASGSACSGSRSPAPASRSSTSSARRPTS